MKRAMLLGLCLGLALDAPGRSLAAPSAHPESTIAAATDAAWQIAVEAHEVAAAKAGAAAEQEVAGAWWVDVPALEISHRAGDWGNLPGVRESEVAVAIPIWSPGQRASARRAAQADVEQAAAAEALARLTVAGQVRELAWKLAEIDAELGGAAAIATHVRTLVDDTERRVAAGDSPRTELLTVRAELIDADARELELRRSRRAAVAEWAVLTGQAPVSDPVEPTLPAARGESDAVKLETHPAVRLATLAGERARARLEQARETPAAAPELRILYREDVAAEGFPTERSAGVGLRLPFGGSALKRPREAAAVGEVARAKAAAERTYALQREQITLAREGAESAARDLAAALDRTRLLRERLALIEESFRAGETSLPEIVRERMDAAKAEAELRCREAMSGLAQAQLRQALGVMP